MIDRNWSRIDLRVKMEADECSFSVLNEGNYTLLLKRPVLMHSCRVDTGIHPNLTCLYTAHDCQWRHGLCVAFPWDCWQRIWWVHSANMADVIARLGSSQLPIFLYMLNCFPGIAKNSCYFNLWPTALIALGNKVYKLCTIGITIYVTMMIHIIFPLP